MPLAFSFELGPYFESFSLIIKMRGNYKGETTQFVFNNPKLEQGWNAKLSTYQNGVLLTCFDKTLVSASIEVKDLYVVFSVKSQLGLASTSLPLDPKVLANLKNMLVALESFC